MRNLQKNLNIIWQLPFPDNPPILPYPLFSSINFQIIPFPSILGKSKPPAPPPFLKGGEGEGRGCTNYADSSVKNIQLN